MKTEIDRSSEPRLSRNLLFLMAAAFLAYSNVSVFFGFVDHLHSLPITPGDYGVLVGALAATALLVRPILSPFFHPGNARTLLYLGTILAVCSLSAYTLAHDFWSMLAVRVFHGFSFAVLGTALMALTVEVIPRDKSAQFFGYLAVATLLPNTLIPPLLPLLEETMGGYNRILLFFAGLMLLLFPLIYATSGKLGDRTGETGPSVLSFREIMEDLKSGPIIRILAAMLLLYSGHAMVFFFLEGYGKSIQVAYAGVFLTLSTAGEIGIRLVAGSFFDRINKARLAACSLAGLCLAYIALTQVTGKGGLYILGLAFGIGWGVAMPVFNGLILEISRPRFRAFHINLGMQMFQAGFFLGPLVGAPLLARFGYGPLYHFCAGLSLLAAILMIWKLPLDFRNESG